MTAAESNRLPVLQAEIRAAHETVIAAAQSAVERAISAGKLLLEAKSQLGYGEWLPGVLQAGLTRRTAQNYMRLKSDGHKELCCRHLGGNGHANGNRVAALETCTEHEAKAATATAKRTSRKMRPVLAHSPGPHRMCQTPQGGNLANDAARRCP
jgi:hypothetical protein